MRQRTATVERQTRETSVRATVTLDGSASIRVATGLGFLDHMLTTLAVHAGFDLELVCQGDLQVDDHHTAEDCALVLGGAISEALGDRSGIARFGSAYVPLDESLARAVVDLSGRPWAAVDTGLTRERIGDVATESLDHVLRSLAVSLRAAVHVDVLRGFNDHHRIEAAFKALALALRQAVAARGEGVPSTKGTLA